MILGAQAYPFGRIDLLVTFGNRANFCSEVLTFKVVYFPGSYHAILGRPCYAKFMAIHHPSHVMRPGCYPFVVDPIVRKKRLTKVLMDRGNSLNILFVGTLDAMRIP